MSAPRLEKMDKYDEWANNIWIGIADMETAQEQIASMALSLRNIAAETYEDAMLRSNEWLSDKAKALRVPREKP